MRKNNRQGFTLAELLIVVAIIAVLVAIAIPIFTSQLEKSREATDIANIRSQYAEVMSAAITDDTFTNTDGEVYKKIKLKQKKDGWTGEGTSDNLYSLFETVDGSPAADGEAWVTYSWESGLPTLHFSGGSGGSGETAKNPNTPSFTYADGATDEQKAATDKIVSTYADAVTQALTDTDAWRGSGAETYKAYYLTADGKVEFEGSQSEKTANKNNAYKMPTSGSATIAGKNVSWSKGDIVAIGVRKNGNVEFEFKNIWGN